MAAERHTTAPVRTKPAVADQDNRMRIFWAVMQMDNPTKLVFADICEGRGCEDLADSIWAFASVEWSDDEKAAFRGMVQ